MDILVVEDERIVALEMRMTLGRMGHRVCGHAPSGEEALQACDRERPDLVLMDIMLEGGLDGIETARILRERHGIPVIYCTAYTDADTLRRALDTKPCGFLSKPVDISELRALIEGRCLNP